LSSGATTLELIRLFVFLLGASALVTILAQRVKLPYTVGLVAFGIAAGAMAQPLRVQITPELVLVVLLPALIFEASYKTDLGRLRSASVGVALLAGPGVLLSAAIIAAALYFGAGLEWSQAFVVGAMLSATDPAAVIATFKRLRSPARLATLVEAESVFNDGTGIVAFSIAVQLVARPTGVFEAGWQFVSVVAVSTILGGVAGYVASWILPRVGDHLIEISLSLVLAYGTYLIADATDQSGVIATAVAGIVLGNFGRSHGMSGVTEQALTTVWEFVAFLATAFVFLVVGFAISPRSLVDVAPAVAWAIAAALAARALIVYGLVGAWRLARERRLNRREAAEAAEAAGQARSAAKTSARGKSKEAEEQAEAHRVQHVPAQWLHVVFWSGLRGAVSTALALSLPLDFPNRAQLQGITLGVVLFTLVVQATTAELVVSRWGKPVPDTSSPQRSRAPRPARRAKAAVPDTGASAGDAPAQ
jgi:CPA1 family monovalent cation:H+ antiporter